MAEAYGCPRHLYAVPACASAVTRPWPGSSKMVGRGGLAPPTRRASTVCSTPELPTHETREPAIVVVAPDGFQPSWYAPVHSGRLEIQRPPTPDVRIARVTRPVRTTSACFQASPTATPSRSVPMRGVGSGQPEGRAPENAPALLRTPERGSLMHTFANPVPVRVCERRVERSRPSRQARWGQIRRDKARIGADRGQAQLLGPFPELQKLSFQGSEGSLAARDALVKPPRGRPAANRRYERVFCPPRACTLPISTM